MFEPFETAKALIDRARRHISEFEHAEFAFLNPENNSYTLEYKFDPETGNKTFSALFVKPLPILLSVIAFDVVNCLRSALDHAVFDSAVRLGASPNDDSIKFPFGRNFAAIENDLKKNGRNVPESLRPKLLSFEPYEGGRMRIWELNKLRNYKIHRTLSPFAAITSENGLEGRINKLEFAWSGSKWDEDSKQLEFLTIRPGSNAEALVTFTPSIGFQEGMAFYGLQAATTFRKFLELHSDIILSIEEETGRLMAMQP